ncbi:bacterial-like Sir2 family [Cryptosporidium sp. chipmunk genotype I]|uniref:bacterial-like Sir2 family n=1 Tax=Cryptosporidium sp. chipmunk genotype I TaxID=1280935 RepID=UPI00351A0495|nr:bacterial-like Sir2 family [Cryptosporidium sp. chipmunk genotype I]
MNTRISTVLTSLKREIFESNKKILFVTGAGLSLDSGIPLFRSEFSSGDDSTIWNSELEAWATIESFKKDPIKWYSIFHSNFKFWNSFLTAEPNEGHRVLSKMCSDYPNRIRVITQNIDGLMQQSSCPKENIIEVHGRIHYLRCTNPNCDYSRSKFSYIDWEGLLNQDKKIPKDFYLKWSCHSCSSPSLPLFLLFDESYTSHAFYQWGKAQKWMNEADIMIFIGTSFSVLCTDCCLQYAYNNQIPIYNVNIRPSPIYFELNNGDGSDFELVEYPSNLVNNITKTSTDFLVALSSRENN